VGGNHGHRVYRVGPHGFSDDTTPADAGHDVSAFDTRGEVVERLVALGARPASSPNDISARAETVLASLPSPYVALEPEVVVMGAKSSASRDKFPRAILPPNPDIIIWLVCTFDYGFATGLMAAKSCPALSRRGEGTRGAGRDRRGRRATLGNNTERRGRRLRFHLRDQTDRASCRRHCWALRNARMILSWEKNSDYSDGVRLRPLSGAMNNRNAYGKPVDYR
jgi:hypothetical protein